MTVLDRPADPRPPKAGGTSFSAAASAVPGVADPPAPPPARPRDLRLDFFRGIGMFIIFIAHMPWNPWTLWIPARFGFSDATEIFVCCSGMASAIAFGTVFRTRGWPMGAARIAYRVWQVYWAHVAVFLVIAALVAAADQLMGGDRSYVSGLNLTRFFADPQTNLVGLLTLTYVPNYFDILPMYLVILALVPVMMALARITPWAAGALVAALWLGASFGVLELPAEPWSDRVWFFNPFAWQLVFFTGFAFMAGWLRPPPVNRWLIALAIAIVAASVPLAWHQALAAVPEFKAANAAIAPLINKTRFGILREVHFLALAYLAWILAGEGGRRLGSAGLWGAIVRVVRKVGQQSLAVFLVSLVIARLAGMGLDQTGRDALAVAAANVAGFAVLIATAYLVGWYRSAPWRRPRGGRTCPSDDTAAAP